MTSNRSPEFDATDPLGQFVVQPGKRIVVLAVALFAMLCPLIAELESLPLQRDAFWLLPVFSVGLVSLIWGWRGALAVMTVNTTAYLMVEIWPFGGALDDVRDPLSETLPTLAIALILSALFAWLAIRVSTTERSELLTKAHLTAQLQVREAEDRYRQMVEQLPAVVYTSAAPGSGGQNYISPRIEQLIGYPAEMFDGTSAFLDKIVHPDDRVRRRDAYAAADVTRAPLSVDYRVIHRDGRTLWIRDESELVADAEGQLLLAQGVLIDITERKQAEESLRESEERFRGAFDDAGSPMALTAMDGRFLRVNDAMCGMLGYTRDELLIRTFPSVTAPEDIERQLELAGEVGRGERLSYQMEKRYVHKDGHYVPVILTVSAVHDAEGRPDYSVVHVQDISARKRADEALRESEERFRGAFDAAGSGIAITSVDGRYLRVNPAMCEMLGYSEDEFLALDFKTITVEEDLPRQIHLAQEVVDGVRRSFQIEKRYRHKDGHIVHAVLNLSAIQGADGRVAGVLSHVQDISDRKRAEEALLASQERFRAAFDDAGSGASITDLEGYFQRVNRAMCAMLGYSESELVGRHFRDVTYTEDQDRQAAQGDRVASGEIASFQMEKRYLHKSGRIIYGMVTVSALNDLDGRPVGIVSHVQDITAHKEAQEALRASEERFRTLAVAAPIGIFQSDGLGQCVYVNAEWTEITGLTLEQSIGSGWRNAIHSDDVDMVAAAWRKAESEQRDFIVDTRVVDTRGQTRHVHIHSANVLDDTGVRVGIVGAVEDVTERKLADDALRRREQEFKALAENAPDIIIRYDPEYRIVYANPVAARTLGLAAADLVGKPVGDVSLSSERASFWAGQIADVVRTGMPKELEYDAQPGETRFWFHARLVPEFEPDGAVESVLLVSHDITARKESENALRKSEERFRAAIEGSMDAFHILRAIRDEHGAITDFELVDMNTRAAEFLNVDRESVLGGRARELFPTYYASGFFDTYVGVVESGQPIEEEFPDPTPGYAGSWLRHQIVPLADGLAITSRDITEERRAEESLRESEERFRAAAEGSMDAFYVARALRDSGGAVVDFQIIDMNSRAEEFLRVTRDDALQQPLTALFPMYRETGFFAKHSGVLETGEPFEEELADPTPGFEGQWLHHQIIPLRDGVAVTSRDITERMAIENALRESEERFRGAFANAVTGMARVAPDGRFLEVNTAFLLTFGFGDSELHDRTLIDLAYPDDRAALIEQLQRLNSGDIHAIHLEGRYYNQRGHLLWGLLGASVIRDRDGAPLYLICQIQEITARKEQEQRLLRQAQHDSLTSLPNRLLFMERLERALDSAERRGESVAVMYLDLDGFKSVNDTLGHLVGDQLLAEVGKRLSRCIRARDTVARLGGDEFSIVAEGMVAQETATRIAARVIEEFEQPFNVGGTSVDVGVSIGIAFSSPENSHPDHLLHEADVALYQAKAAGKRRFVVYRQDLTPEQEDQLLAERTADWRDPSSRTEQGNR